MINSYPVIVVSNNISIAIELVTQGIEKTCIVAILTFLYNAFKRVLDRFKDNEEA